MTPKRPIELVNASIACADAWAMRDGILELFPNDKGLLNEANKTCEEMDMRYSSLYRQWQILGGTSDIESIALVAVGQLHNDEDGCGNDLHPYDFTPTPRDMPDIDMDNVKEIPF